MIPKKPKVLIVDDEQVICDVLHDELSELGYQCTAVFSGNDALAKLAGENFDVVLLDIRLPGISGLEVLTQVRSNHLNTPVIMITAINDVDTAVTAMRQGAYDYLSKPFNLDDVAISISRTMEQKRLELEIIEYRQNLEDKVTEQTMKIRTLSLEAITALVYALEAKDKYTSGHSQKVADISVAIAQEIGLPQESIENIRLAGLLHDLGKIGIRESILNKPGRLDNDEYQHVKKHPEIGEHILVPFTSAAATLRLIRNHHERYDGTGYPDRLQAGQISLGARILAVSDAYEAMTSERPYRKPLSDTAALAEIESGKGLQFDPEVAMAFFRSKNGS
ncbi:HD domain-containing phosphohydrolase [Chloroflexota bacterium]